jgi:hypothetical protein
MLVRTGPNSYSVAGRDQFGALRALAVDLDLSAVNCIDGERARFIETRGPKPFIQSYLHLRLFFGVISPRKLFVLIALAPFSARSQTPVIQDNSFLMEEAYNQEKGIVQHINTFRTHRGSADFEYSFTQEWPVGGQTRQLSYDLPITRSAREAGIGDVRINYRYQLVGSGETRFAISPRLSVTLPTGDWKKGRGIGAAGIETMLPVSYALSKLFTTHSNVGLALTPSARNSAGARADSYALTLGQSLVMKVHPNIQPLVEAVYTREQDVVAENSTEWREDFVVSPGVRVAFNFASGLQIIPGFAVPIGVGPSSGDRGMFFYLSFEHPFTDTR